MPCGYWASASKNDLEGNLKAGSKRRLYKPYAEPLFAASAIEHVLYLLTRNVLHVANSGAAVFNPWKDDPSQFPL
jgi:hypothetical protein